jgi:hypothetical protein
MSTTISNSENNGGKMPGGCTGRGWQPGQSGNARGRRPGGASLTAALRRTLTRKDAEEIARKLVTLAKSGDLRAVTIIFERLDAVEVERRLADLEAAVQKQNQRQDRT